LYAGESPISVRVFDRDAGGSEMATVDKTYPRSECPPASPYIGDYHHTTHVFGAEIVAGSRQ